jgi:hypothetical protein
MKKRKLLERALAHPADLRFNEMEKAQAEIGVFLTIQEPSKPMREAAAAGFYSSPGSNTKHPRIQLLTVKELLGGKGIDYPSRMGNVTFKKAPKAKRAMDEPLGF